MSSMFDRLRGWAANRVVALLRVLALALVVIALVIAVRGGLIDPARPNNIILISLDTLGAAHVGAFGYERQTTPRIDSFLRDATLFRGAVAQAPSTTASHAALFTSRYPSSVVVWKQLRDEASTLAEQLDQAGYATWGFVDGGNMSRTFGFSQGFDHYEDRRVGIDVLTERAQLWLEEHHEQPFFLFLHSYGIHTPYTNDARYTSLFGNSDRFSGIDLGALYFRALEASGVPVPESERREYVARYDAGIRKTDDALGAFLDGLAQRGLLERTMVVLVSDHGEEFLEHGKFGHKQLFLEPNLHVPLAFRLPGGRGQQIEGMVELLDVLPTIRSLLGLPRVADAEGQDLSATILRGQHLDPERPAYAQLGAGRAAETVIRGRYQLMVDRRRGRMQLFDLETDPGARHDLAADRPGVVAELTALIENRLGATASRINKKQKKKFRQPAIDARLRRELKQFGYLED